MKKIILSSLILAFATIWINAQTINQIPFIGQRGENVRIIQSQLTQKGFSLGTVDGQFGGKTIAALSSFQSKNTLKSHGMVDLPTLEKLGITFSPIADAKGYLPLSWESASDTNKIWSDYTFQIIEGLFADFDKCQDIIRIRPDYQSLTKIQKINVLGELISAIAKPESSWNPTSWMFEAQGIDVVTGQQVRSEGLLQLSYQDKKNYKELPCRFDWNADKNLPEKDIRKTIMNPKINLEFGINILAKQIRRTGKVILINGVYWAVIKENGKYQKIDQITLMVRNLKFQ
jgi:peptidoglycan hydrolase-like protein with peptidoglycan-binding domain